MDINDLVFFKNLITRQLDELIDRGHHVKTSLKNSDEKLADPADQAAVDLERNFMLRIRDREYNLIKKLKMALERIENGTYGICEVCGDEISINRLKARPFAELCIECKTRAERMERVIGL